MLPYESFLLFQCALQLLACVFIEFFVDSTCRRHDLRRELRVIPVVSEPERRRGQAQDGGPEAGQPAASAQGEREQACDE